MKMLCRVVLATVTFLLFFYSTTIAMSLMYALDSVLLRFNVESNGGLRDENRLSSSRPLITIHAMRSEHCVQRRSLPATVYYVPAHE